MAPAATKILKMMMLTTVKVPATAPLFAQKLLEELRTAVWDASEGSEVESGKFPEKLAKKVVWGTGILAAEEGGRFPKVTAWVDEGEEEVVEMEDEVGKEVLRGPEDDGEADWGAEEGEEEGLACEVGDEDGEVVRGGGWVGGVEFWWIEVDWSAKEIEGESEREEGAASAPWPW
jgi:hypothetical protein